MKREDTVRELARLATEAGLGEPSRRWLVLYGIPARVIGRLELHSNQVEQVFSDLSVLADDPEWMYHWFENVHLLLGGRAPAAAIEKLRALWPAR